MKFKVSAFCWQCLVEAGGNQEEYSRLKEEYKDDVLIEFNNENYYEFTCPKGHKHYSRLQSEKFEILFDLAVMALLDGYAKECVSTLASAWERFIEFYIKVISARKNIPPDRFIKMWKAIAKQSERQAGAFYLLQLFELGETKFLFKEDWVAFRNKVIHQGYIPTSKEAIDYGEYILSTIFSVLATIRPDSDHSILKARIYQFTKEGKWHAENEFTSTASVPTVIDLRSIDSEGFGKKTFKEAIESVSNSSYYKDFYKKGL